MAVKLCQPVTQGFSIGSCQTVGKCECFIVRRELDSECAGRWCCFDRANFDEPEAESRECPSRDMFRVDPSSESDWGRDWQLAELSAKANVRGHVSKQINQA